MDAKEVLKRFNMAKSKRKNFEAMYKEGMEYAAPQRNTFDNPTDGAKRDGKNTIYDSTPQSSSADFVSNIQASIVPPDAKWCSLSAGFQVPEEEKAELQKGLDYATEAFFSCIKNSNFDIQVSESLWDLLLGTGALLFLSGDVQQPFKFVSVPLSQLYLENGANSDYSSVFREHSVPAREISKIWNDAKISEDMQNKIKENNDFSVNLVECTYEGKITVFSEELQRRIQTDGYIYVVVDTKQKEIIVRREMETSPWIIFRWNVVAGEVYGRGPLLYALPDIKSLEKAKELILKNASLAVAGTWTVQDDGVVNINAIKILPGAIIPVASNGSATQGRTIEPLQRSGDFNVGEFVIKDLRTSISKMLYSDPLGAIDSPVKSATEISMRAQEMAKRIGAAYGRLQRELVVATVNRGLTIMQELGIIDSSKFIVDGRIVNIEYKSPLSEAQANSDVMKVRNFVEIIASMLGVEVAVGMVKPEMVTFLVDRLGIPANLVRSSSELQQIIANVSQQQQAQQQQIQVQNV